MWHCAAALSFLLLCDMVLAEVVCVSGDVDHLCYKTQWEKVAL